MTQLTRRTACLCIGAVLAALPLCAVACSDADLLETLRAGTKQRSASVTSGKGIVNVLTWSCDADGSKRTAKNKLTVAFKGSRIKIDNEPQQGWSLNFVAAFDGAEMRQWYRDGKITPPCQISKELSGVLNGAFTMFVDPRTHGLLSLADGREYSVDTSEVVNGHKCVVVSVCVPGNALTHSIFKYWVDTGQGFTVPKTEWTAFSTSTGKVLARRVQSTVLKKCGADLWAPSSFKEVDYDKEGTKTKECTVTFDSGFQFNVPIADEELRLTFPKGLEVHDEILGTTYKAS